MLLVVGERDHARMRDLGTDTGARVPPEPLVAKHLVIAANRPFASLRGITADAGAAGDENDLVEVRYRGDDRPVQSAVLVQGNALRVVASH